MIGYKAFHIETIEEVDWEHHTVVHRCEITSASGEYEAYPCYYCETCEEYASHLAQFTDGFAYEIPLSDFEFTYSDTYGECRAYYNGEEYWQGIGGNEYARWLSRVFFMESGCTNSEADGIIVWEQPHDAVAITEDDLQ